MAGFAVARSLAIFMLVTLKLGESTGEECEASKASLLLQKFQIRSGTLDLGGEGANESTAGSKVLVIGDSNAAFAGPYTGIQSKNTLQEACAGSTVVNKGDPGTKVSAWMSHGLLANAISAGTGWTHVYLSIGGNDLGEDYGCGRTGSKKNAIKADITKLIAEIKKLTTAKIVLTGYTVTAADDTCSLSEIYSNVDKAMMELASADPKVTYASIATAAGGILDPAARAAQNCDESLLLASSGSSKIGVPPCRGDKQFFMSDYIHLNAKGYTAAWKLLEVQNAFGCGSTTVSTTQAPQVCADQDASVGTASGGLYTSCAQLMASIYNCNNQEYGAQVKALCPVSCNCAAPVCCKGASLLDRKLPVTP